MDWRFFNGSRNEGEFVTPAHPVFDGNAARQTVCPKASPAQNTQNPVRTRNPERQTGKNSNRYTIPDKSISCIRSGKSGHNAQITQNRARGAGMEQTFDG